jgi:hypothetical protein
MGSGWEDYEPDGYDLLTGPEPDYEPDPEYIESAHWRWRFDSLFPRDERHFNPATERFTDPDMARVARWDDCTDPLAELFRAVLFLRGWQLGQRILWPSEVIDLVLLLLAAARCDAGPHLTPDGGDLTRIASAPFIHARATLTAAPPARVCPAGATG